MATAQAEDKMFVGVFPDFGDPTVLFWGNAGGLERFAGWLRNLDGKTAADMPLSTLSWVTTVRNTDIQIEIGSEDTGMKRLATGQDSPLIWRLSNSLASHFADLIDGVAASHRPCHHYLDSEGQDDLVVVVSHGEYDGLEDQDFDLA